MRQQQHISYQNIKQSQRHMQDTKQDASGVCRLCLRPGPADFGLVLCFGPADDTTTTDLIVADVLHKHFWFKLFIARDQDAFVCTPCWSSVATFHRFYQTVWDAHQNLYAIGRPHDDGVEEVEIKPDVVVVGPLSPPPTDLPKAGISSPTPFNQAELNASISSAVIKAESPPSSASFEWVHVVAEAEAATFEDAGISAASADSKQPPKPASVSTSTPPATTGASMRAYTRKTKAQHRHDNELLLRHLRLECRPCGLSFAAHALWTRHNKREHRSGPANVLRCCDRRFTRVQAAIDHCAMHENPNDPGVDLAVDDSVLIAQYFTMRCDLCAEPLDSLAAARHHHKQLHQQSGYLQCGCGKRFRLQKQILEHCEFHASPALLKCDVCCSVFSGAKRLANHMQRRHGQRMPAASGATAAAAGGTELAFECFDCKRRFAGASKLRQHMHRQHRPPTFECTQCSKKYATETQLTEHAARHSGERPFRCEQCPRRFLRRFELRSHQRMHSDERPFVCEVCGMAFRHLGALTAHLSVKHRNEEKFACDVCARTFKRKALLDYHTKVVHTGVRPLECPTCRATFVYPQQFQKHLRIHTGEKPYACDVCGKSFNSWDNRRAHQYVHSAKKLYECAVCGAGFMRKPLLLGHMKEQGHESDTIVMNKPDGLSGMVEQRVRLGE